MPDESTYDLLLDLVQNRTSVRSLKPDPIPEGSVERILEVARWAMSGANAQPWEFVVVRDPATKAALEAAYREVNVAYVFWMEQQRLEALRHPLYQVEGDPHAQLERVRSRSHWGSAPVLIVVLGDGRRQWGTVMGAHTFGRNMSHLTDALANVCTLIQLAAASLGLASQWMSIHVQEPFKRILGVPDLLEVYNIVPVGYPAIEPRRGTRRPLADIVHRDRYEMGKYMTDEDILAYLYELRGKTMASYRRSTGEG